jgi:hypothetical protein
MYRLLMPESSNSVKDKKTTISSIDFWVVKLKYETKVEKVKQVLK